MQQPKQSKCRKNQNSCIKEKHTKLYSEITFLRTEEYVRLVPAAVVALIHFGVRHQVRHLLVHVDLLGGDRTVGVLEKRAIEWPFAIQDLIDQPEIMIQFASRFCLETREQSKRGAVFLVDGLFDHKILT